MSNCITFCCTTPAFVLSCRKKEGPTWPTWKHCGSTWDKTCGGPAPRPALPAGGGPAPGGEPPHLHLLRDRPHRPQRLRPVPPGPAVRLPHGGLSEVTCPRRGDFFCWLSLSSGFFPPSALPSALPPPPLPLPWCSEEVPPPQREGDLLFFQKGGAMWPSPPFCIPQRDFPARRGYAQILAGRGLVPLLFPAICPPPCPPSRCCGVPKWCPHRSGRGIFYFFKRGSGHRPPFASPRGTFLPGGAMRKFWRGGGLSALFPAICPPPTPSRCCGVPKRYPRRKGEFSRPVWACEKARKQMLPGFCVTPNSRSSSSPSAGSCGRCAPPWGRCPGSTAPGRPCRR